MKPRAKVVSPEQSKITKIRTWWQQKSGRRDVHDPEQFGISSQFLNKVCLKEPPRIIPPTPYSRDPPWEKLS